MKHSRTIIPSILVLVIAVGCLAATDADKRLDQKVSIQTLGQPLGSFVTPLGMQTGVVVKASKDVAELKIAVLTKELPLSQLLLGIAEALHIQIKTLESADGTPTYEFYEEPAQKQKADRLFAEARSGLRRQMDHAADLLRLGLSAEELQKKIDADEMAGPYIGDPSFRAAVEVYSNLPEKDRNRLWDISTLPVGLSGIPEQTRNKIIAIFDENRKQREQADNVRLTDTVASLLFEVQDDPLAGRALSFSIIGTGTHGMTYMFMQLPEGGLDLLGNDEFFVVKEDKETGAYIADAKQLPEKLTVDAGIELPEVTLTQAIQRLHEKSGISIIADWYTPRYSAQAMVDKWAMARGDTIAHEVEKISEVFMCKWKTSGDACVMSSKTWFEDCRVEIPISTIQRWNAARQKTLRFELPELIEMSLLSEKQQKTFRYYDLSVPNSFSPCMRALRFCSTLARSERDRAATEQGLPADILAEDQKLALTHWLLSPVGLDRKPSAFTDASVKGAQIRIFRNESGWVFRVQTSNGQAREDVLTLG